MACGIAIGVVFVLCLVTAIVNDARKTSARREYQASLARLKAMPTDPNLREVTLHLGRRYSYLMRDRKGVTTYDEAAIRNDIEAVCANAVFLQGQAVSIGQMSIEQRLGRLQDLHASGRISTEEYATRRQQILSEI